MFFAEALMSIDPSIIIVGLIVLFVAFLILAIIGIVKKKAWMSILFFVLDGVTVVLFILYGMLYLINSGGM